MSWATACRITSYDIVYRHVFAVNLNGDYLAFGSITGGLWVSEDQGASWACVTHTLPSVHAVQFV
jgi:hypothetical protein